MKEDGNLRAPNFLVCLSQHTAEVLYSTVLYVTVLYSRRCRDLTSVVSASSAVDD